MKNETRLLRLSVRAWLGRIVTFKRGTYGLFPFYGYRRAGRDEDCSHPERCQSSFRGVLNWGRRGQMKKLCSSLGGLYFKLSMEELRTDGLVHTVNSALNRHNTLFVKHPQMSRLPLERVKPTASHHFLTETNIR